ncbi:hypothetical protein ACTXT7_016341 [Hymenolepis weldensis]
MFEPSKYLGQGATALELNQLLFAALRDRLDLVFVDRDIPQPNLSDPNEQLVYNVKRQFLMSKGEETMENEYNGDLFEHISSSSA